MKHAIADMTPERLEIRSGGTVLRIVWPDGRACGIQAALLRRECRSARALRMRIDGAQPSAGDVRITAVQPVGAYAVNIAFSDGERRGVYPWSFLAALAEERGDAA